MQARSDCDPLEQLVASVRAREQDWRRATQGWQAVRVELERVGWPPDGMWELVGIAERQRLAYVRRLANLGFDLERGLQVQPAGQPRPEGAGEARLWYATLEAALFWWLLSAAMEGEYRRAEAAGRPPFRAVCGTFFAGLRTAGVWKGFVAERSPDPDHREAAAVSLSGWAAANLRLDPILAAAVTQDGEAPRAGLHRRLPAAVLLAFDELRQAGTLSPGSLVRATERLIRSDEIPWKELPPTGGRRGAKRPVERLAERPHAAELADPASLEAQVMARLELEDLVARLSLSRQQQQIFELWLQHYPQREIAALLGIGEGQVNAQMSRVRRKASHQLSAISYQPAYPG